MRQQPVHGVIAKPANAVKENGWLVDAGRIGRKLVRHGICQSVLLAEVIGQTADLGES